MRFRYWNFLAKVSVWKILWTVISFYALYSKLNIIAMSNVCDELLSDSSSDSERDEEKDDENVGVNNAISSTFA